MTQECHNKYNGGNVRSTSKQKQTNPTDMVIAKLSVLQSENVDAPWRVENAGPYARTFQLKKNVTNQRE